MSPLGPWKSKEQWRFAASMAAALCLALACCFAYLAWRDANLTRREQTRQYLAQQAPNLELVSIKELPTLDDKARDITFAIRNVGSSQATNLRYSIFTTKGRSVLLDTRADVVRGLRQIEPGRELALALLSAEDAGAALGWEPKALRAFRSTDTLDRNEQVALLLVVEFDGPQGDHHSMQESIAVMR